MWFHFLIHLVGEQRKFQKWLKIQVQNTKNRLAFDLQPITLSNSHSHWIFFLLSFGLKLDETIHLLSFDLH